MKKKQKENRDFVYNVDAEDIGNNYVSEPDVSYGHVPNTLVMRTIGMMGMNEKKDYTGIKNDSDFIGMIRTGIPKQAMSFLMTNTAMSMLELAAIIHTSDRTLRRYKPEDKLSQEQSERMIEVAKLYSKGEAVFGSLPQFRQWMDTNLLPMGNKKPKEYLDTSMGINMLMDELGRIEHGIFA